MAVVICSAGGQKGDRNGNNPGGGGEKVVDSW